MLRYPSSRERFIETYILSFCAPIVSPEFPPLGTRAKHGSLDDLELPALPYPYLKQHLWRCSLALTSEQYGASIGQNLETFAGVFVNQNYYRDNPAWYTYYTVCMMEYVPGKSLIHEAGNDLLDYKLD
jgi:hypothetical protein